MFQTDKKEMYVCEQVLRRPIIKRIQSPRLKMTLKENISQFALESAITARVCTCFVFPGLHPGGSAHLFLCLHPNLGLGLLCARRLPHI